MHSHEHGAMLHSPRLYDWGVRIITFGRERSFRRWTLDLAGLQAGNAVLDVGCGTGTLLLAAAERVGATGGLHGVEPSPEMAARARSKAARRKVPLRIVEGSADRLPYADGSFDAVLCTMVLHHLPASRAAPAIREFRRVLRPGGRVVVVDWQRPRSLGKALAAGLGVVYLLHSHGPGGSPLDEVGVGTLLAELGFGAVARHEFGGGVLGAAAGRLP